MKKNLKDALTDVRDEMVTNDEKLEMNSEKISASAQDRISKKWDRPKILNLFTKRNLAIAASFILIIAMLAGPIMNAIGSMFLMGSTSSYDYNTVEKSKNLTGSDRDSAPSAGIDGVATDDFKPEMPTEESPMESMPQEMPSTGGGTGQVEIFPTLPSNSSEKIIYTFKYKFETIDFDKSTKALNDIISKTNSYIEHANTTSYSGELTFAEYLVRVPKDKSSEFQSAMNGLGVITNHSISSENRTKEYKDMDVLKQTLEIKEKRYQALLEKAETVEDMMNIESRLAEVEMQKSFLKQNLDSIDHDVDYQYFNLTIQEVKETADPVGKVPTFFERMGREFVNAFASFFIFLQELVLYIIRNFIFLLILLILLIFIYVKWIRKPKTK